VFSENLLQKEISIEEYVDGFMIQVYQTKGDNHLFIATRSKQDASGTFYSARPFRSLFLETYGSSFEELASTEWDKGVERDDKEQEIIGRWWSYVVQHPEHRMVTHVSSPRIHLVQQGQVASTGRIHLWEECASLSLSLALTEFCSVSPHTTVQEWIQQMNKDRPWWFRGIVVKDRTGERWRFRSEKYMAIQALRGREPTNYE
jgi:hypothetical protein